MLIMTSTAASYTDVHRVASTNEPARCLVQQLLGIFYPVRFYPARTPLQISSEDDETVENG